MFNNKIRQLQVIPWHPGNPLNSPAARAESAWFLSREWFPESICTNPESGRCLYHIVFYVSRI